MKHKEIKKEIIRIYKFKFKPENFDENLDRIDWHDVFEIMELDASFFEDYKDCILLSIINLYQPHLVEGFIDKAKRNNKISENIIQLYSANNKSYSNT